MPCTSEVFGPVMDICFRVGELGRGPGKAEHAGGWQHHLHQPHLSGRANSGWIVTTLYRHHCIDQIRWQAESPGLALHKAAIDVRTRLPVMAEYETRMRKGAPGERTRWRQVRRGQALRVEWLQHQRRNVRIIGTGDT